MDTIAEGIELPDGCTLGVCLDAYREKIYTRFYVRKKGRWHPEGPARTESLEAFLARLPAKGHLAGNALVRYGKKIVARKGHRKIDFLPASVWYPRASELLRCFGAKNSGRPRAMFRKMTRAQDFLPLYLRRSEPEEKKSAGQAEKKEESNANVR